MIKMIITKMMWMKVIRVITKHQRGKGKTSVKKPNDTKTRQEQ